MESLTEEDPRSIGGYELRARLGRGGFGQVYLGLSPGGRAVAIKVLRADLSEDLKFLQRFRFEVEAARQVNGLYTAQVVAAGLNDRRPWVATAFVPGPPLDQMVAANGPLPEPAVWRLLAGLVEALQEIHGCGLVHRDLKPENVLLSMDGPRVIDFGISKSVNGAAMTATGVAVGTPSFMAPEQAAGLAVGPDTDVFSLGCVLAYAAIGEPPFGRDSPAAVIYRTVHAAPALDGVPPRLRTVIEQCLAKDPQARPTLTELAKFGRDGQEVAQGQSSVAFWPSALGQLIREYQSQFDDAQGISGRLTARVAADANETAIPADHETGSPPADAGLEHKPTDGGDANPGARAGGRRRLPWVGVGAAGVAVLLAGTATAAYMLSSGGTTGIQVPNVIGYRQVQADQALRDKGFTPQPSCGDSSTVAGGGIYEQKPDAGTSASPGSKVQVLIAKYPGCPGPAAVVPDVGGLAWPQAEARIREAGLVPHEGRQASGTVKAGEVIGQQPGAGKLAAERSAVTVIVSTGAPDATPSATAATKPSGTAATKPSGSVTTTPPATPAPTQNAGFTGTGTQVPNVVNQAFAAAEQILRDAGFAPQLICGKIPSVVGPLPGVIYQQIPAANASEPQGSTVQIVSGNFVGCISS